jgi:VIT1/CCC1 family predicted Fe2+/Mn2+ transporter
MELTTKQKDLLFQFQKQEINGYAVYQKLALQQKDANNRDVLNQIAEDELKHYNSYKSLTGKEVSANRWHVFKYTLFATILGPTFAIKLMEKNEGDDQILYAQLSQLPQIPAIISDEEKHERQLIELINEEKLNYMGSVVLGLNDALVELTGALAGFTFALQDPKLIALTGSITGIAAALSMAASEYLSTKSENAGKHAVTASIYTGIAYVFTVIVLILPYLLIHNLYFALATTFFVAVLIIAAFNYYYAIVKDEKFIRRFSEMAILSISVALLSFGVGFVLSKFIGVTV